MYSDIKDFLAASLSPVEVFFFCGDLLSGDGLIPILPGIDCQLM